MTANLAHEYFVKIGSNANSTDCLNSSWNPIKIICLFNEILSISHHFKMNLTILELQASLVEIFFSNHNNFFFAWPTKPKLMSSACTHALQWILYGTFNYRWSWIKINIANIELSLECFCKITHTQGRVQMYSMVWYAQAP